MSTEHKSDTPKEIRDLWQTPKQIFNHYHRRFNFKLDVAASKKNALCDRFYDIDDNALDLNRNWSVWGNWCNPPYSNIMPWVEKAIQQMERGCPTVMLIPADTSVKWFKKAFDNCTECHFISGRLAFINADTQKPVSGNNKGSVVFVFDPRSPVKQHVSLLSRDVMMKGGGNG